MESSEYISDPEYLEMLEEYEEDCMFFSCYLHPFSQVGVALGSLVSP